MVKMDTNGSGKAGSAQIGGFEVQTLVRADDTWPTGRLAEQLRYEGYLYLPGFFGADMLTAVRRQLGTALRAAGWVDDDDLGVTEPDRGFRGAEFRRRYAPVQATEELHSLAHSPAVMALMRRLHGRPVFTYPYKVARLGMPTGRCGYFTPPHQDFVALHLCTDVLTAWVALTPCGLESGGLRVLPGSHLRGYQMPNPEVGSSRPYYLAIEPDSDEWWGADYAVGDVVVFHSLTVHCSTANRTSSLRLSVDFRYQSPEDPVRPEQLQPYGWGKGDVEWCELTRGWRSLEWISYPSDLTVVPFPRDQALPDYLAHLAAPPSWLLGQRS